MMKKIITIIVTILTSITSFGQGIKIIASEDTYTEAGDNDYRYYGKGGILKLKNSGKEDKYHREIFLKFDLDLKKNTKIESVVLFLYGRVFINNEKKRVQFPVSAFIVDNNWRELRLSWKKAPDSKHKISEINLKQGKEDKWYSISLDADILASFKDKKELSIKLTHNEPNSLGAEFYSKDKRWKSGDLVKKEPYIVINGSKKIKSKSKIKRAY